MHTDEVEVLVRPARSALWRPLYPGGVLAGAAAVWCVVALAQGAGDAAVAAVALVVIALLQSAVRVLLWRLRPGRVTVACDDMAVHFMRGARVVRSCPWTEIRSISVGPASRWPEWSRWASFCAITCVAGPWPHGDSVTSPDVLLVRADDVARAQAAVDAAVRRHAPRAEGLSAGPTG